MSIFESLENLNVSEECFDDIMDIVEELLSEDISKEEYNRIKDKRQVRMELEKRAADKLENRGVDLKEPINRERMNIDQTIRKEAPKVIDPKKVKEKVKGLIKKAHEYRNNERDARNLDNQGKLIAAQRSGYDRLHRPDDANTKGKVKTEDRQLKNSKGKEIRSALADDGLYRKYHRPEVKSVVRHLEKEAKNENKNAKG
jgi:hypothetical protein